MPIFTPNRLFLAVLWRGVPLQQVINSRIMNHVRQPFKFTVILGNRHPDFRCCHGNSEQRIHISTTTSGYSDGTWREKRSGKFPGSFFKDSRWRKTEGYQHWCRSFHEVPYKPMEAHLHTKVLNAWFAHWSSNRGFKFETRVIRSLSNLIRKLRFSTPKSTIFAQKQK